MQITLIILAVIAAPFVLNELIKKTNWYKNQIPDLSNYPRDAYHEYDIVNIGSSSAMYAFDYSETGLKGLNWAMQPQSMEYSYKVLKEYAHVLKPGAIVIIPFAPFSGLSVEGKWPVRNFEKYTCILQNEQILNEAIKRRKYPLFYYRLSALKKILRDEQYHNVSTCSVYSYQTNKDYENDAVNWISCWKHEFHIDDLNAPMSDENQRGRETRKRVFCEIINYCKSHDLKPVVVMPPVHPSLAAYFTPEFREQYIDSFIQGSLPSDVRYIDYLDEKSLLDTMIFTNAFFLNEEGRKVFTKQVLSDFKMI